MRQLIDKKAAIDALLAEYKECARDAEEMGGEAVLLAEGIDSAIDIIRRMQPIDPVIHAYWIEEGDYQVCSNCGEEHCWEDYRATYCDTCGAKMDMKRRGNP